MFIYLFLTVFTLRCCAGYSSGSEWQLGNEFLVAEASLVAEHGL